MHANHRRSFLKQSLATGAVAALSPTLNVLGANDDLRVAVVGFRGHGQTHIRNYLEMPGVRVVALCDVDQTILDREVSRFEKRGQKVAACRDIRRLLERKDIDAVSLATPNHWHALGSVWACQAGKDVCVEKPASHNIWEGRQMVRALASTAESYRPTWTSDPVASMMKPSSTCTAEPWAASLSPGDSATNTAPASARSMAGGTALIVTLRNARSRWDVGHVSNVPSYQGLQQFGTLEM